MWTVKEDSSGYLLLSNEYFLSYADFRWAGCHKGKKDGLIRETITIGKHRNELSQYLMGWLVGQIE